MLFWSDAFLCHVDGDSVCFRLYQRQMVGLMPAPLVYAAIATTGLVGGTWLAKNIGAAALRVGLAAVAVAFAVNAVKKASK